VALPIPNKISLKGNESPKWYDEEISSVIEGVKEHPLMWNHQLKELGTETNDLKPLRK
jgi:hypothetical protein